MMNDETEQRLNEYLDDELGAEDRAAFEARLDHDADLREELNALRTLRAGVNSLPRSLDPDRDLWPSIASRMDQSTFRSIDFRTFRRRQRIPIARYLVAAAALVLFALSAPVWFNPPPRGVDPPVEQPGPGLAADPEFVRVSTQYLAARDELMSLLQDRKADIAPETYAVVEDNLSVIASAVAEIEVALAAEPESVKLEQMLYAAYRSEVNLLRQAVQLSDADPASNPTEATQGGGDDV